MAGVDERKRAARKHFKQVRHDLGTEERARVDAAIADRVVASPAWQEADVVLPYLSVGDEVDTRELIRRAWAAGKAVAVPRVTGRRQMAWYRIVNFDDLEESGLHVEEPLPDASMLLDPAAEAAAGRRLLAIVPGLAFDAQGYRMGYGGGFYDTFLADLARLGGASIGLCHTAQLVESFSDLGVIDVHDRAVDFVVTED